MQSVPAARSDLLVLAEADLLLRRAAEWSAVRGRAMAAMLVAARLEAMNGGKALQEDLRKASGFERPEFSKLVAALVKDGIVERTADDWDNRLNHLRLTQDGRKQLYEFRKQIVMMPTAPTPANRRRVRHGEPWSSKYARP